MRRRFIILAGAMVVVAIVFGALWPRGPAAWGQVHAGIGRAEVLALVGTPQQSGWPENITETWQINGFVTHRRLFIVYDGERVRHVWDGTWVRGCGWWHPRRESL